MVKFKKNKVQADTHNWTKIPIYKISVLTVHLKKKIVSNTHLDNSNKKIGTIKLTLHVTNINPGTYLKFVFDHSGWILLMVNLKAN